MTSICQNTISNENNLLDLLKQVIGHTKDETDRRFNDAYGVLRMASKCAPYNATFVDATALDNFSGLYKLDICQSVRDVYSYSFTLRVYKPHRCLIYSTTNKEIFSEIKKVLQILLTIQQSSWTVERIFFYW